MAEVLLGAVAYDPKTVTIWEGFRAWFREAGLDFDFVLYSNYERQVEELLAGAIDVAWNSPLAWVRARRLAEAQGRQARALAMRDTDQDLVSVVLVRADGSVRKVEDVRGQTVAVGAIDSPQATLIPLFHLTDTGLRPKQDFDVRRFDLAVGKHGDHIGGEGEAARALVRGEVAAACVMDATQLTLAREGIVRSGETRVLTSTPLYDHCNMTAVQDTPALERFASLLLGMSYEDPVVRPLLDLEGLKKWLPGRTSGYKTLDAAVDELSFYDRQGNVIEREYRP